VPAAQTAQLALPSEEKEPPLQATQTEALAAAE
jgi:hypothetical protein